MCSRWLALGLLVLSGPPGVAAQSVAEARERLANAVAAWQDARARSDSVAAALDTIRVAPFLIVTGPSAAPDVRASAELAADSLRLVVGDAITLMDTVRVVVPAGGDPTAWARGRWTIGTGASWVNRQDTTSPTQIMRALIRPALVRFIADGGTAFSAWVGTFPPRPILAVADLERAYLELVTRPTWVNRRCLHGDLSACTLALGVRAAGDPLTELYDAEDRRRLVGMSRRLEEERDLYARCRAQENDAACTTLLRSRRFGRQATLSNPARWTLLALVLESGGSDAWRTLMADTSAAVADRLANASGHPLDSLIAAWQRRVVASGRRPALGTAGTLWTALLWVALAGALGFRSTRWRSA